MRGQVSPTGMIRGVHGRISRDVNADCPLGAIVERAEDGCDSRIEASPHLMAEVVRRDMVLIERTPTYVNCRYHAETPLPRHSTYSTSAKQVVPIDGLHACNARETVANKVLKILSNHPNTKARDNEPKASEIPCFVPRRTLGCSWTSPVPHVLFKFKCYINETHGGSFFILYCDVWLI